MSAIQPPYHRKSLSVILILLVFSLLACSPKLSIATEEQKQNLRHYLDASPLRPAPELKKVLQTNQSILFVQNNPLRGDSSKVIQALLPSLYDGGLRQMGLFFVEPEQQDELSAYITAQEGTSHLEARQLILKSDATLLYREYVEFLEILRDFNQRLPQGNTPLIAQGLGALKTLSQDTENQEVPRFDWILPHQIPDSEAYILRHFGPENGILPWGTLIPEVVSTRPLQEQTFLMTPEEAPVQAIQEKLEQQKTNALIITPYPYRAVQVLENGIPEEMALEVREDFGDITMEKPLELLAWRLNGMLRRKANAYTRQLPTLHQER